MHKPAVFGVRKGSSLVFLILEVPSTAKQKFICMF